MNSLKRVERMRRYVARTTADKKQWTLNRYWDDEEFARYQDDLHQWGARMGVKHADRPFEVRIYQEDLVDFDKITITAEVTFKRPMTRSEATADWAEGMYIRASG